MIIRMLNSISIWRINKHLGLHISYQTTDLDSNHAEEIFMKKKKMTDTIRHERNLSIVSIGRHSLMPYS